MKILSFSIALTVTVSIGVIYFMMHLSDISEQQITEQLKLSDALLMQAESAQPESTITSANDLVATYERLSAKAYDNSQTFTYLLQRYTDIIKLMVSLLAMQALLISILLYKHISNRRAA